MARWFTCTAFNTVAVSAVALAGCAPAPVDPKATVTPLSTLSSDGTKGTATVHVIFPCHITNYVVPSNVFPGWKILIDGKQAGEVNSCQFREIAVPAGRHAIRLASPTVDFGSIFGNGEMFALPQGGKLFLIAEGTGQSGFHFREISADRGVAEIASIRSIAK